ncbi:hypothetical protein BT96DRAFT_937764 [Gymnopus androsaceus JB14]|uniref:Uncharacterized protein n=1 Tax=Gymnopus androsaceus JB14 TaxID=1447944 RepID=A0A6A4HRL4_9AGAR|nr:hypothetical protein BT96DRAFT_937764 [Gymnopus androsaceus JB14]
MSYPFIHPGHPFGPVTFNPMLFNPMAGWSQQVPPAPNPSQNTAPHMIPSTPQSMLNNVQIPSTAEIRNGLMKGMYNSRNAASEADEARDWPNGTQHREQAAGDADADKIFKQNKWAWTSNGLVNFEGAQAERRRCLGHLTEQERVDVQEQVYRSQNATPHQLRAGDTGLGSVPLPQIAPKLAGARSARYHVAKAKVDLGITPASPSKSSSGALHSWSDLEKKLNEPFIIDSRLHGSVIVLVLQTPFMRQMLHESIDLWLNDSTPDDPDASRHGCITDGDHSFFRLWISQALNSKLTQKRFKELSKEASKAQWQHYLQEANSVQVGCEIHFFRSGKRLTQNGALVPCEKKDKFMEMLYIMTAKSTTSEIFASTVHQLQDQFPRIQGWLGWWLRPAISSMIFPSTSSINPLLADKVPSTSNPIEAQHSNLHSAMGKDHDALSGVHKLYLYIKQREKQYKAVMDGHISPQKLHQNPPPKRKVHWDVNDGRAPDTEDALLSVSGQHDGHAPSTKNSVTKSLISAPLEAQKSKRMLRSYVWANNSCFFDVGLELWYRVFAGSSLTYRSEILALLPKGSTLENMFQHFQKRLDWTETGKPRNAKSMLSSIQDIVRQAISIKFNLHNVGDYGCARSWLARAVTDELSPEHIPHWKCGDAPFNHALQFTDWDVQTLLVLQGKEIKSISTNQYVKHLMPRHSGKGGTGAVALVGRVVFSNGNHFIADILLPHNEDLSTFRYDDMRVPLSKRDFFVYRRTSDISVVTSDINALEEAYRIGQISWSKYKNPVFSLDEAGDAISSPSEFSDDAINDMLDPDTTDSSSNHDIEHSAHKDAPIDDSMDWDEKEEKLALDTSGNDPDIKNMTLEMKSITWNQTVILRLVKVVDIVKIVEELLQSCQFVMIKTKDIRKCKLYAAKVVSWDRNARGLLLQFYSGNIYSKGEAPAKSTVIWSIQDVQGARGNVLPPETLGSLKWPISLMEDAVDLYSYENAAISKALNDAQDSITDIISGTSAHPIVDLFRRWSRLSSNKEQFIKWSRLEGKRVLSILNSFRDECFDYDILPGDYSLSETACIILGHKIQQAPTQSIIGGLMPSIDVARVLLDLVVVRVYLNRTPEDDIEIYHLARKYKPSESKESCSSLASLGYLKRHLSVPESALAASQSSRDTRFPPVYIGHSLYGGSKLVTNPQHNIRLFHDGNQAITAHNADGSSYSWRVSKIANNMCTPQWQIVYSPPIDPPPLLPKSRKSMDVDSTPSKPYNLRSNPKPSRLRVVPKIKKRTREDSWDDPEFVSNMKRSRKMVSQEALEIFNDLEDNKPEIKNTHEHGQRGGRVRGRRRGGNRKTQK